MRFTAAQKRLIYDAVIADHKAEQRDGSLKIMHSYFYRASAGGTPDGFALSCAAAICRATGLRYRDLEVEGRDQYANWPKTSYFVAIIRLRATVGA